MPFLLKLLSCVLMVIRVVLSILFVKLLILYKYGNELSLLLAVDENFDRIQGNVSQEMSRKLLWSSDI